MALNALAEQARLWRLVYGHAWRSALGWLHGGPILRWRPLAPTSDTLLIAPQDIRTADPTIASEIYAGRFAFAGKIVETGGRSPFDIEPPSTEWQRGLHEFGWMRHMRAADSAVIRANVRALIDDWIKKCGRRHDVAWEQDVTASRVLSWLAQSPVVLDDCDRVFYRRFLRSLGRQVRYLRHTVNETPEGVPRLRVAIALAAAAVSMSSQTRYARQSARRLDHEIGHQILPDGGHISRNPAALLEVLADLLPVRQAMIASGTAPTQEVMNSVDRMMPMIRFFRHRDGALAHFNGMGATARDLTATILAYDDTRGQPLLQAPHSGYQRLEAAGSVVVMDAAPPPPVAHSGQAHAGCLSFEFSSGGSRIIVNCGVPNSSRGQWRQLARSTAAHSTLTIDDTSSCRFLSRPGLARFLGVPILAGPGSVPVTREDSDTALEATASHDGYAAQFGLIHERTITLSADGRRISGTDRLSEAPAQDVVGCDYAIRLHLHPAIKASRVRGGNSVLLVTADKTVWEFRAPDRQVEIEESIYFSDIHGHRRAEQIVLHGRSDREPEIKWSLIQRKEGANKAAPQAEAVDARLPL